MPDTELMTTTTETVQTETVESPAITAPEIIKTAIEQANTEAAAPLVNESEKALALQLEAISKERDLYKADFDYFQAKGGREAIQPFLEVQETLLADDFNPQQFRESLLKLDKNLYRDVLWEFADTHKKDLLSDFLQDPKLKEHILKDDPEFQEFQLWKVTGGNKTEDELVGDLDPNDPVVAEILRQRKELRQHQAQLKQQRTMQAEYKEQQERAEKERRVQGYVAQHYSWLNDQVKQLGWGEEYNDDMQNMAILAEARFEKDVDAVNAFKRAVQHKAEGNDHQANRYDKIVRAKLAQHFKAAVEHENKKIALLRKLTGDKRVEQGARKEIDPKAQDLSNSLIGNDAKIQGEDTHSRILQRIQQGVAAGRIPEQFLK